MPRHECSYTSCAANGYHYVLFSAIFTHPEADAFRVTINRDAYDFQSYVTVEVWTKSGWSQLFKEGINSYPALVKTSTHAGSDELLSVFDAVAEQAVVMAAFVTGRMPLSFTGTREVTNANG